MTATLPGELIVTLSLGFSVPLLWRRNHPFAVVLAMVPFAFVNTWTGALLQASWWPPSATPPNSCLNRASSHPL